VTFLPCMSVFTPQGILVYGLAFPNILADSIIFSFGIHVISETFSGVKFLTLSFKRSNP